MNITKLAATLLESLDADERDRIRDWAERIATGRGRKAISAADIRAAVNCAGEEFLPEEDAYTDD